jgi:hypothetical protein
MTVQDCSVEEKLAAVERLIVDLRWARNDPALPEHKTLAALKAIALDLRGQHAGAPRRTLDALTFQINSAARSKARVGHVEIGHLQAVAECLTAHWSVVRQALERFEAAQ